MLFGTRAPLWKYIFGIFSLMTAAHRTAATVVAARSGYSEWLTCGLAIQALAGLVVAVGLFRERRPVLKTGGLTALTGVAVGLWGGPQAGGLASVGGGLLLLALVALVLTYEKLEQMQ